jgi:DNA mismatch repair protein MutS
VERAKKILAGLETGNAWPMKKEALEASAAESPVEPVSQMSFFGKGGSHPVVEELKTLDLNDLTPLEALNLLGEWKKKIEE